MDNAKEVHIVASDEETHNSIVIESSERLRLLERRRVFRGISTVFAGFLCNFIVFGISFSYGVFQEYYTDPVSGPLKHYSISKVALIGSTATALTYIFGILNSKMLFFFRAPWKVMVIGCICMSIGLITASFSNVIYQFILSQGVLYGIGSSFMYMPPVVCAPLFFKKYKAFMMGFLFAGTGVGAFVMSIVTRKLLTTVGWRWSLRILGFINLFIGNLAALLVRVPDGMNFTENKRIINFSTLKSTKVVSQLGASLFQSAGYIIPLIFMSKYANTLSFSNTQGALFIGINNLANAVFKVIIGFAADKTGRLNMIILCNLLSTLTIFTLWLIGTRDVFISFVVLYGIFSGAIISLLPTCLIDLFGASQYQALTGLMYFCRGIGSILGSPIAGVLVKDNGLRTGDYQNAIIYNGVLLAVSTILLGVMRHAYTREKGFKWFI